MFEQNEIGEKFIVTSVASKIEIYRGWCKKCGICIAFCPRQVLVSDKAGYPVVKDADRCTACDLCVDRCPDFAITVHSGKENHEKTRYSETDDNCKTASPRQ